MHIENFEEEKGNNEKPKLKKKKNVPKEATDTNVEIVNNNDVSSPRTPKRKVKKSERITRSTKKKQVNIVEEFPTSESGGENLKKLEKKADIQNKDVKISKAKETRANRKIRNLESPSSQITNHTEDVEKSKRVKNKVEHSKENENNQEVSNFNQNSTKSNKLKKKSAILSKSGKKSSNAKKSNVKSDNDGFIELDKNLSEENPSAKTTPKLSKNDVINLDRDQEENEFELKLDNDDEEILNGNKLNQGEEIHHINYYNVNENQSLKEQKKDELQPFAFEQNDNIKQNESLLTNDDDDDADNNDRKNISTNQKFKNSHLDSEQINTTEDKSSSNAVDSSIPNLNTNTEPNVTKDIFSTTFDKSSAQTDSQIINSNQSTNYVETSLAVASTNTVMPCNTFYNSGLHEEKVSHSKPDPILEVYNSNQIENPKPKTGARIVKPKQIIDSSSITAKQYNIISDADGSHEAPSEAKKFVVEISMQFSRINNFYF
jgi:hypothetical protein